MRGPGGERVAVVGSRDYPDLDAVRLYVRSLPHDAVVVTGGARGVDETAEDEAMCIGLDVEVFHAEWTKYGRKRAGFIRNTTIVERSDRGVAFWDGVSNGTADTIAKFRRAGKPIEVKTP